MDKIFEDIIIQYVEKQEDLKNSSWMEKIEKLDSEEFLIFEETFKNVMSRGTIFEAKAKWLAFHDSKKEVETIAFESSFSQVQDYDKW